MVRVEAVIRPSKLDDVRHALGEASVHGMSVSDIRGCGRQKGFTERYRGSEYVINLLHKVRVDVVVARDAAQQVIDAIAAAAHTGEVGDGKIFVTPVEQVVRIRTRESGADAL